jgi:perosamine synthetase
LTEPIPLSAPDLGEEEVAAVVAVLRSGRLSLGPRLDAFERAVAARAGRAFGVGVNSGTSGLFIALAGLGVGPGDEVITSPFSFVASANAIVHAGATPVFTEIDPATLNLDPDRIEAAITPRTRAILVPHIFGRPAPMPRIAEIAGAHGLCLVEDACEAIGAEVGGRPAGGWGDAGVFAFYPNKPVTSAEGGVVVTDDDELAETMRRLGNQGRADSGKVVRLGWNFRLSEVHAAIGEVQMTRLDGILARRAEVARRYDERLRDVAGVTRPDLEIDDGCVSFFVYVVRVPDADSAAAALADSRIGVARYFPPLHLLPHLPGDPGDFPDTEEVSRRTLALPFFNHLKDAQIDRVCAALRAAIGG